MGERITGRRHMSRLIHAICVELVDWKSIVRKRSAKLLVALLVYSEVRSTGGRGYIHACIDVYM